MMKTMKQLRRKIMKLLKMKTMKQLRKKIMKQ